MKEPDGRSGFHARQTGGPLDRPGIHTIHRSGWWLNERDDGDELPGRYRSKAAAAEAGRLQARRQRAEHVIYAEDGTVSRRHLHKSATRL